MRLRAVVLLATPGVVAGLAPRPPIAIGSLVEGCNPFDLPAFAAGLTVWIASHSSASRELVCQGNKKGPKGLFSLHVKAAS